MELHTAVGLIKKGVVTRSSPQTWADLGAGRGLFTHALSTLLPEGSAIFAVDQQRSDLLQVRVETSVSLHTRALDFVKDELNLPPLDGILMANALHFVKDKRAMLQKLKPLLKSNGYFIIIEYETSQPNRWVPYPIHFAGLKELMKQSGWKEPVFMEEVPSLYHGKIYSAVGMPQPD